MNHLQSILDATRRSLDEQKRGVSIASLEELARERLERGAIRPFLAALQTPDLAVIAEHKRSSPSVGAIETQIPLEDVVRAYDSAGAAALSILTEPDRFGGRLEDLQRAREVSDLPILRKDFIVDRFQIAQAAAHGADAVLLIVAAVEHDLAELQQYAHELGLAALVEVHDRDELEVANAANARLIDINNRNLSTLRVDKRRVFELMPDVAPGTTVVAASGISEPEQLAELESAGVAAALIGEALMHAVAHGSAEQLIGRPRQPA